jgi:hypothetical protein
MMAGAERKEAAVIPVLRKMPVSCGKRPVKIEERDGQHSESVTK